MEQINNRILFVLVLYKCPLEDSKSFLSLLANHPEEQSHIFVYDNSPCIQHTEITVAQYIHDTQNGGLGKAYNTACRFAQEEGYQWLMLLDQDTTFPENALQKYQQAIVQHSELQMIVPQHKIRTGQFFSPTHYHLKTSQLQEHVLTGVVHFKDAAPINSGMLVSVNSFTRVNGYDEAVWLDFSDIRFIEKFQRYHSTFYVMPDVICLQDFSATESNKDKRYQRHCIYLECAVNYTRETWRDTMEITYTTLRLTLAKCIREHTMRYLNAYWKIYIRKKNDDNNRQSTYHRTYVHL